jgi:nickel-dependent lactate racemase
MSTTLPRTAATVGGPTQVLTDDEVRSFVTSVLADADLDGQSLCLVVPDGTRSCPLGLLVSAVREATAGRISKLTILVALGTHAAMDHGALESMLGTAGRPLADAFPGVEIVNHEWWKPETFVTLGTIGADTVDDLSVGRLVEPVPVRINRQVVEHDVVLVVGPVFPHEVVGFSGGNKYFFPGVAGPEIIDLSHWLGALITSAAIIGTPGITPVRALIDTAAALIPTRKLALCVVNASGVDALHAMAFGTPEQAWEGASAVSAQTHVRYLDAPVRRVVSVMPSRYEDMWTGAKGFYKVEPVVADGGEVIVYAPGITQMSAMHPEIVEIGYHCKDFFAAQWEAYRNYHWGVLAHSTHLRGAGTYDPATGTEDFRVQVTLATGIPEEVVHQANLSYLSPDSVDLEALRADPDTLVVDNAGEILFRLSG